MYEDKTAPSYASAEVQLKHQCHAAELSLGRRPGTVVSIEATDGSRLSARSVCVQINFQGQLSNPLRQARHVLSSSSAEGSENTLCRREGTPLFIQPRRVVSHVFGL